MEYLGVTGVEDKLISHLNTEVFLEQNYPNPFDDITTISFYIPSSDHVSLKIYDITGKEVDVLINNKILSGKQKI